MGQALPDGAGPFIEVRQISEMTDFPEDIQDAAQLSAEPPHQTVGVTERAATQRAIEAVWRIESARLIARPRADDARRRRSPRISHRTRSSPRSRSGRRRASRTTRAPG